MEIDTLLSSIPAYDYPAIRENLNLHKVKLTSRILEVKEKLQTLLPDIRAGKEGEKELIQLLGDINDSPFEYEKSEMFLSSRGLEIRALNLLVEGFDEYSLNNFRAADYKQPTRAHIMMNHDRVVIFDVNILQSKEVTEKFLKNEKVNSSFWYHNDIKASDLGKQRKLFKNFLEANQNSDKYGFLISVNLRNENQPIAIKAKTSGRAEEREFIIPDKPTPPILVSKSYDSFIITVEKPKNFWVTGFKIDYWRVTEDQAEARSLKHTFDLDSTMNISVSELNPLTTYEYRLQHVTEYGLSPASEVHKITTRPSSEPSMLKSTLITDSSIKISWDAPLYIGKGIQISSYRAVIEGIFLLASLLSA